MKPSNIMVAPDGSFDIYHGGLRARDPQGGTIFDHVDYTRYSDYLQEGVKNWTYMKFPFIGSLGQEDGWYRVGPLARVNNCDRFTTPLAEQQRAEFMALGEGRPVQAALAFHWAEVGLIGLAVIVLATAFTGIIEEHRLGHAFEEALPFTALLVVFFAIVGVIHDQHLFQPVIHWVMEHEGKTQEALFYMANGVLSMISDNVFVATVYVNEVYAALEAGAITREHFELLTVAINTGTNIPSVATPNGQAAFLFLLTSALAPLIRLSYGRMVIMALPYTVTMSITGLLALWYLHDYVPVHN